MENANLSSAIDRLTVIKNTFPLFKLQAFKKAPAVMAAKQNLSLQELVEAGQRLCDDWGICYIGGVKQTNVWLKLLNEKNTTQSERYYQDIQTNLAIALDYLHDPRISLTIRKKDLNDIVMALSVCDAGIYDRLESLVISKKKRTTHQELLPLFRLEIIDGITTKACSHYSNRTYNVFKKGYAPHIRVLFKQWGSGQHNNETLPDLNLPITSNGSALDDHYHQGLMDKWFFTPDKIAPLTFFNEHFKECYTASNIIDWLVAQLVQAVSNSFLDHVQLTSQSEQVGLTLNRALHVYNKSTSSLDGALYYKVTINGCTFDTLLKKEDLFDEYDSIHDKATRYEVDKTITLTDDEKTAILYIALKNKHTQNLERFDFHESADYTRFSLFQNKCMGLPLIVANPDLWPVFYNDEHNEGQAATTAYQLKSLPEQRISMMHLLGDDLFELRHIKHDQKTYRLLDGCRELCYWIDEMKEVRSFATMSLKGMYDVFDCIPFKTLQEWGLAALFPITASLFIYLLEQQGIIDFSGAVIKDIDFTVEPFCDLAFDCLGLEKDTVKFDNVRINKRQLDLLIDKGRQDLSGVMVLEKQLASAIKAKKIELALVLLNQRCNVNYVHNGRSFLWLAIENNLPAVCDAILKGNVEERILQDSITRILTQRIIQDWCKAILFKILRHINLNQLSQHPIETSTELHFAVINCHKEFIPLLCQRHADILMINKDGLSPLDLAMQMGRNDLIEDMLYYFSYRNLREIRPARLTEQLLKAIQQSNRFLALYLLKNRASCSDNMLFLAIQKNLPDVVDYMLKHSIDNTALQNCIQRMLKQKKITGLSVSSLAHMLKHKHLELLSLDIADSAFNLALINEHYEIIPWLCQKRASLSLKQKSLPSSNLVSSPKTIDVNSVAIDSKPETVFTILWMFITTKLAFSNHDLILEIIKNIIDAFIFSKISNQTDKTYMRVLTHVAFDYIKAASFSYIEIENYLLMVKCIQQAYTGAKPDLHIILDGVKAIKSKHDEVDVLWAGFFKPNPLKDALQNVIEVGEQFQKKLA